MVSALLSENDGVWLNLVIAGCEINVLGDQGSLTLSGATPKAIKGVLCLGVTSITVCESLSGSGIASQPCTDYIHM